MHIKTTLKLELLQIDLETTGRKMWLCTGGNAEGLGNQNSPAWFLSNNGTTAWQAAFETQVHMAFAAAISLLDFILCMHAQRHTHF